jgi:hypothetical protein
MLVLQYDSHMSLYLCMLIFVANRNGGRIINSEWQRQQQRLAKIRYFRQFAFDRREVLAAIMAIYRLLLAQVAKKEVMKLTNLKKISPILPQNANIAPFASQVSFSQNWQLKTGSW